MSDVRNLLCVVVRTLPNVIVFAVNLIVPEGLDTYNKRNMAKPRPHHGQTGAFHRTTDPVAK